MGSHIGYAILCLLIVFLLSQGIFAFLEDNYGIEISTGKNFFLSTNEGKSWNRVEGVGQGDQVVFAPEKKQQQQQQDLFLASAEGVFKSSGKAPETEFARTTEFEGKEKPAMVSRFVRDPQDSRVAYLVSEKVGKNKLLVSYNEGKEFKEIFVSQEDDKIISFATGGEEGKSVNKEIVSSEGKTVEVNSEKLKNILKQIKPKTNTGRVEARKEKLNEIIQQIKTLISSQTEGKKREIKCSSNEVCPQIYEIFQEPFVYYMNDECKEGDLCYEMYNTFGKVFLTHNTVELSSTREVDVSKNLYVGTYQGNLFKSEDGGESWFLVKNFSRGIKQIEASPHKDGKVYLYLASDLKRTNIPPFASPRDPVDPPIPPSRMPEKVMVTTDGGNSFYDLTERIDISSIGSELSEPLEMKKVEPDPMIEDRVYLAFNYALIRVDGNQAEVVKSITPSLGNKITAFTINPKDFNMVYLGIGNNIYTSKNEGESWKVREMPKEGQIQEIEVNPEAPNNFLVSINKYW